MAKRKRFTVGLWMTLKDYRGKSTGLQMWSILPGTVKNPNLEWFTVVLAHDDNDALQLAQHEYAGVIKKQPDAA